MRYIAWHQGVGQMPSITMKELLEAGVHFGHQTKRWNPKMKEYIFGERNGIYIIDLQKTLKMFKEASKFVQDLAADGRIILFVGTKRQAQRCDRRGSAALWNVLHQPAVAGRTAHQLGYGTEVSEAPERARRDGDGWPLRAVAEKRSPQARTRAQAPAVQSGGHQEHEPIARCGVRDRFEQRADCGARSPQAGYPGGRSGRYEL